MFLYLATDLANPLQAKTLLACSDDPSFGPLNLLISYPYLKSFLRLRSRLRIGRWVLDSGAFSAAQAGRAVDVKGYSAACKSLDFDEHFALDVIGDHKAGLRNYEYMRGEGLTPIPVYHPGEPWWVLDRLAADTEKIAVGSAFSLKKTITNAQARKGSIDAYVSQVFARVWPKRVHGLAMSGERLLQAFPFDSVDSTTWCLVPQKFHRFRFNGATRAIPQRDPITKTSNALFSQVREFQRMERKYTTQWRREMQEIGR